MEQTNFKSEAWYQKTWLVILLCIIFFPVGLYALWKNSSIKKGWKITVTTLIAIIVIASLGNDDPVKANTPTQSPVSETDTPQKEKEIQVSETDLEKEKSEKEKEAVTEKLKAKAKRDWPNDYMTQEFWVNEQIEAYEYMITIEDNPIKKKAQNDWPLDFVTQKFWYNEQIEAKERMQ